MINKRIQKISFLLYHWILAVAWTTALFFVVINTGEVSLDNQNYLSTFTKALGFGILFILVYKALINTFRLRVKRLAVWRSLQEYTEDVEFVSLIEALLVVIAVLMCMVLILVFELELFPIYQAESFILLDANFHLVRIREVLADTIGVLSIAFITSFVPIFYEFEYVIIQRLRKTR